jgi:predicted ATPase
MKIKQIEIMNYKQFKNLSLDLSYPKGHEKDGQPLDKICIIGQSGTGKTNLLKIVRDKIYSEEVQANFIEDEESNSQKIYFVENVDREYRPLVNTTKEDNIFNEMILNGLKEKRYKTLDGLNQYGFNKIAQRTLEDIDRQIRELEKEDNIKVNGFEIIYESYISINESAWRLLEKKIENYEKERLRYIDILSNKLLNIENYTKDNFKEEKQKWEEEHENLAEKISDKLNTFLIKFNLELTKIDENQKSYNDLTIKDLSNGNIIDYDNLSTGTKNLISTFIPLKIHNPKDSIILIDEPENSFYPDIQRKLTELYMEAGENNQVIFATHSPIIASSFEPWEVVELKFDENNQIYREFYFDGENHINNYFIDPRMLTWTGILTDVFDLKEDSNFSFREKKLMEYATLKAEIKALKDENEKESKFLELKKISKLLGLKN